jgi:hypothetical protein
MMMTRRSQKERGNKGHKVKTKTNSQDIEACCSRSSWNSDQQKKRTGNGQSPIHVVAIQQDTYKQEKSTKE